MFSFVTKLARYQLCSYQTIKSTDDFHRGIKFICREMHLSLDYFLILIIIAQLTTLIISLAFTFSVSSSWSFHLYGTFITSYFTHWQLHKDYVLNTGLLFNLLRVTIPALASQYEEFIAPSHSSLALETLSCFPKSLWTTQLDIVSY